MKKLLLAVFVFINLSLTAQIPNPGFECWTSFSGPPAYDEACFWASFNPSSQFGYPVFVYKSTDSHTGTYAIEVRTMGFTNPFPPYQYLISQGLARISNDYQNGHSGFAYNQRPTTFSAWVKYHKQGPDSAEIKIKLFKWNPNLNQPDDVATAKFYVSSDDSVYHCKSAAFVYMPQFMTSGFPDSACVYITSSMDTTEGNIIKVDDVAFGNCITSVSDVIDETPHLSLYPNPASDIISFAGLPSGADRIKLFEISGRMVAAEVVSKSYVDMDVKNLDTGIYFYGIYDENNKIVLSGKFSVVR